MLFGTGRTAQPQTYVQANLANPITRGLAVLAHPLVGNALTGQIWTRRGTLATILPDIYGPAFKTFYDGTASDFAVPCFVSASGDRTLVAYASNFGNSIANLPIVSLEDADSYDGLAIGPSAFRATMDNNGSPTISVGEFRVPKLLAGRRIGNQVSASMDRTFTTSSITGTRSMDTTTFRVGRTAATNSTMTAIVYWAGYWNRALNNEELLSLSANPWQLFTQEPRKIWVPTTSSSTTVVVTGVAATGAVGTVTVTGKALVGVTGVFATGDVGTVTVSAGSVAQVTGVETTSAVGTTTAIGKALVAVTGVLATGEVGTVVAGSGTYVDVTGVQTTSAVGNVAVPSGPIAVEGVFSTGYVGNVLVITVAWVPIDPVVPGTWATVNDSQTPGWTALNDAQTPNWN